MEKYIEQIKDKIANGGPDRLKDQLQRAQDLLTKLESKIADCAAGNHGCSDLVKEQVAKKIEALEKNIASLEEKKANADDPKKMEHILKILEKLGKKLEFLNELCD